MPVVKKKIVVKNKQGLHARPAALFVQIANKFDSRITLRRDEEEVNGKSILGLLLLAAPCGTALVVRAEGSDAGDALDAIENLIADRFGEDE